MTEASDPMTVTLTGQLPFILISAGILAWLVSLGLLRLYRQKVVATMSTTGIQGKKVPSSLGSETSPSQPESHTLELRALESTSPLSLGSAAEALFTETLQGPWRAGVVYAGGGLGYACIMALCYLTATELPVHLLKFLVMFWLYSWPAAISVALVAGSTREIQKRTIAAYFVIYFVLSGWVVIRNSNVAWTDMATVWLVYNLGATVLFLAFLARRVRAVGPLVFSFMVVAIIGSNVVLSAVGSNESALRGATKVGITFGLNATGVFIGLIILGFVAFGVLGWVFSRWIGSRYERKKISDQSVPLDSAFLLFGIVHGIFLAFEGAGWILSGLMAFLGYKVFVRVGFFWVKNIPKATGSHPRLLVLRVFSLGKRSEQLFDAVGLHWRHVGPIHLITGPDLAMTTVKPHEFLDFLSGKLSRRFIDGPQTLDRRFEEMDLEPDQDGRLRVTDFFCHNDTWPMVLSKLVNESDVVLMDLRGFSSQNAGCQYEVNELINVVPLEQVVFVIDGTTDEQFLRQIVKQFWNQMNPTSPNRRHLSTKLTLFRIKGSNRTELYQLLRALCGAVKHKSAA